MRYLVEVDNDREVLVKVSKERLDEFWHMATRLKGNGAYVYVLSVLGLLDDELMPNWR